MFRIGLILSQKIADNPEYVGYIVDSEYNKRGSLEKIITGKNPQFPDLLLHMRGNNRNENLMIAEFKVSSTPLSTIGFRNDVKKLKYLTADNEYNYQLGAHVYLCSSGYVIKWYISGIPEHGFTIYSNKSQEILCQPSANISNKVFLKKYEEMDSLHN